MYAQSQWRMSYICNVVSHWLGAYTKWSLCIMSDPVWVPNRVPKSKLHFTCSYILHKFKSEIYMSVHQINSYIDGLVQDCSISRALAIEILQSVHVCMICMATNVSELEIIKWDRNDHYQTSQYQYWWSVAHYVWTPIQYKDDILPV